jgi:hypothetical protein
MWVSTILNIFTLRANPQDLPTSRGLTAVAIGLYVVADVGTALAWVPFDRALVAGVVDTLLLGSLAAFALTLRRHTERLPQTLMALTGCGVLFGIVSMALNAIVPDNAAVYASLPALFWLSAVYGHILRHALEVPYVSGIIATGIYLFLSLVVVGPFLTPAAIGS